MARPPAPGSAIVPDWHESPEGKEFLACVLRRSRRRLFGLLERPVLPPSVAIDTASYKVFVSGKSGVGKTALVAKLAGLEVPTAHHETIEPSLAPLSPAGSGTKPVGCCWRRGGHPGKAQLPCVFPLEAARPLVPRVWALCRQGRCFGTARAPRPEFSQGSRPPWCFGRPSCRPVTVSSCSALSSGTAARRRSESSTTCCRPARRTQTPSSSSSPSPTVPPSKTSRASWPVSRARPLLLSGWSLAPSLTSTCTQTCPSATSRPSGRPGSCPCCG
ncbi:ciliogenesis and planar polarity effector 2 isoform X2 [Oryctolagus cuniculus]|uniref:ciliogenesis and planar polarity effector 2 isoform X2 n=1 Tax=Oryctolagus cuniculus TaxID=9986 RepID=UPI003879BCAD